jgi:hypothetical protein
MTRARVWIFMAAAFLAVAVQVPIRAQQPPTAAALAGTALAGTWTLVSIEEAADSAQPVRVQNARGLLVLDDAGLVFEAATRADRTRPTAENRALTDAQRVFATYSGFWGRYKVDAPAKTLTAHAEGAVSPSVMGRDLTRTFSVDGDRLTLTSASVEPHQRGL